jgi:hypothetical protein
LSKINEIVDKVGEIARFYPNLDFGYILVAPKLLSDMLAELNGSSRIPSPEPRTSGFESLAFQTHHGQLYVKPERDLEEDDFVLMDRSGNRYSYKHFFVNMLMEKILLRGTNE